MVFKCIFQWWDKHESMFFIINFLAYPIFDIVGSQIEMQKIFFFVNIYITLKRCL